MKFIKTSIFCLLSIMVISSCVKQKFTNPPDTSQYDPNLAVTTTLRDLSAQASTMNSGQYRTLGDSTIYGIVIADDKTGNFYKQIVIQDSTGGITVTLDKTTLYGDYPIGRKVYIKLKGLILMNYSGLPEITFAVSSLGKTTGIPSSLLNNYVIKASYPNTVAPLDVAIGDLFGAPQKYYNTLVRIGAVGSDPVEFDASSNGVQYAASTSTGAFATSRFLVDAMGTTSLNMYNSSFATFQPAITPTGSGSIVTVFSNYGGAIQLLIRDTSDVKLNGPRF